MTPYKNALCKNLPIVPNLVNGPPSVKVYTHQFLEEWDLECGTQCHRCKVCSIDVGYKFRYSIKPLSKYHSYKKWGMFHRECMEARMAEEEYIKELDEYEAYMAMDHDKVKYAPPAKTVTVANMMKALQKLTPDAKLVITESGFYSNSEFADVVLPTPYTVASHKGVTPGLPTGTQVFQIGHCHQSY